MESRTFRDCRTEKQRKQAQRRDNRKEYHKAKTNLKEMPVEVRSSGKEPQNDFFAAFLEYVKQHADEAIAAVEAQKNAAK